MTLPGVPQGFTQSVDSSRTVSLAWAIPTTGGAPEGYVIEAGSAPGLADLAVISVPGLVFIAPNVAPGTYYVRVRAVNGAGRGPATLDAMVVVR
jgi:Fibronectin type III domain